MACEGFLACAGYPGAPFFDNLACFTCIPGERASQFIDNDCDTGCANCPDTPQQLSVSFNYHDGERFMSPTERTRDARGRKHDLRGPRPLPLQVEYRWAPYRFQVDGEDRECFNNLCEGMPPTSTAIVPGLARCEDGSLAGDIMTGRFVECGVFIGNDWPVNRANNRWLCRHILQEQEPTIIRTGAPRLHGPIMFRTGGCAANMMILATARIPTSLCQSSYEYQLRINGQNNFVYYQDGGNPTCKSIFNEARITGLTAGFKAPSEVQDPDGSLAAATVVQNAAMQTLKGSGFINANGSVQRFDRIDSMVLVNGNSALGHYKRTFDGAGLPIANLPVVDANVMATLAQTGGIPFDGTLRVYAASIEAHVIAYRREHLAPGAIRVTKMKPYTRARIQLWLGHFPGPIDRVRTEDWRAADDPLREKTMRIRNNLGGFGIPGVQGDDDRLVYLLNGQTPFRVPWYIEWWGWLGEFSEPAIQDQWQDEACGNIFTAQLAASLSPLTIPSWSTHHDSKPFGTARETYTGNMELSWTGDLYNDCCN